MTTVVPLIPTPIPHPAFEQYHFNEIINDRLRTFRRLNHNILIIRVVIPAAEQQIMNPITIIIPGLNTSTEANDN